MIGALRCLLIAAASGCACAPGPRASLPTRAPTELGHTAHAKPEPGSQAPSAEHLQLLAPVPESGGVGWLTTPSPLASDRDGLLQLEALLIDAEPFGDMAAFAVEHVFHNPTDEVLEGKFHFTLPPGSVVTGCRMQIAGSWMEGEFVERTRARAIYQSIVDDMRDPAILEWEGPQTFSLRVFPIEARTDKRIEIRYLAPLYRPTPEGPRSLVYPLSAPAMQTTVPLLRVSLSGQKVIERRNVALQGALTWPIATSTGRSAGPIHLREQLGEHYRVWIRIRHADGRIETMTANYSVDISAPELELWLTPVPEQPHHYDLHARQLDTKSSHAHEIGPTTGLVVAGRQDTARSRTRHERYDARRVEVTLPNGRTLRLRRVGPGQFVRRWRADTPLEGGIEVRVVAGDSALNLRRFTTQLDVREGGE